MEQGLQTGLEAAIGLTDGGIKKPYPRRFNLAPETAQCGPDEAVMVGDRVTKDIVGADSIEMRTVRIRVEILANEEPSEPLEHPGAQIVDIRELPALLVTETG